jgi:hypothetical protein
MLPDKVSSLRVEQRATFNPSGPSNAVYVVSFMVGEHGPFVEEFSAVQYTPESVRDRVAKVVSILDGIS